MALTKREAILELLRELTVGASHEGRFVFVASEPEGRTQGTLVSRAFP